MTEINAEDADGADITMRVIYRISSSYQLVETNAEAAFLICHDVSQDENNGWIEVTLASHSFDRILYH